MIELKCENVSIFKTEALREVSYWEYWEAYKALKSVGSGWTRQPIVSLVRRDAELTLGIDVGLND